MSVKSLQGRRIAAYVRVNILPLVVFNFYARRHNDLEGHNNFSSTIYNFFYSVFGTSLLYRSTVAFS